MQQLVATTTNCTAAVPAGRLPLRLDYPADKISEEGKISERQRKGHTVLEKKLLV